MNVEKLRRIYLVSGALAVALLVLSLCPSEGRAVTGSEICAGLDTSYAAADDYDNDGFTNSEECNGIDPIVGSIGGTFPGYMSHNEGIERTGYLDPSGKDLFLILVRATNTLIPGDVSPATLYSNGLPVTVHVNEIAPPAPGLDIDRRVTSNQKAVMITESLDTTGDIFGAAQQGTPNGLDGATVYTQRIVNFVDGRCVTPYTCIANPDASGYASVTGIQNVKNFYIRNVIAHEMGHVSSLTPTIDRRFEWHYAPGSGTVMEQSASYTKSNNTKTVTFYLSTRYAPLDVVNIR